MTLIYDFWVVLQCNLLRYLLLLLDLRPCCLPARLLLIGWLLVLAAVTGVCAWQG